VGLFEKYLEELDICWKSIKTPPTEEGFYVVAVFNEGGILKKFDTDWVYIKRFGGLICNSSYNMMREEPTHWMSREDFRLLLGAAPKKDENGDIVI